MSRSAGGSPEVGQQGHGEPRQGPCSFIVGTPLAAFGLPREKADKIIAAGREDNPDVIAHTVEGAGLVGDLNFFPSRDNRQFPLHCGPERAGRLSPARTAELPAE